MVNVKNFGATGDGVTDDRIAIQAALNSGDEVVFVPEGMYVVGQGAGFMCLSVPEGVHFNGEGEASVLIQKAGIGGSVRLIYPGPNSSISDMLLDGNKSAQSVDEHRTGVFCTMAPAVTLTRVVARNFTGDGFYIYNGSNGVEVEECEAYGNDRNGITYGGGTLDGAVRKSSFHNNAVQQFDSEPGVAGHVDNLVVDENRIDGSNSNDYALTISGGQFNSRSRAWQVTDNEIHGGVRVVWADDILIEGNDIINHSTKAGVEVFRTNNRITIRDNTITNIQNVVNYLPGIYLSGTGPGSCPADVLIENNDVLVTNRPTGLGVRAEGTKSVKIFNNRFTGPGTGSTGIWLRSTIVAEDFESAEIVANTITGFGLVGITVSGNGAARLNHLLIDYNKFDGVVYAMDLDDGTGVAKDVNASNNTFGGQMYKRSPRGVYYGYADRWVM